jgi:tungstate transport system ATP-binding protein
MRADPSILPLRLTDVSYRVGERALVSGLSCALVAGERTVILGPNGAGTSVLLRLCHGLIAPSAGRVEWAGAGGAGMPHAHAMVFQRPVLLRRSAHANIAHALSLGGVPASAARTRRFGSTNWILTVQCP